jgi:dUTP pyrophosphatase
MKKEGKTVVVVPITVPVFGSPPEYKTSGSAGFDISANLSKVSEILYLKPGEIVKVPTGLKVAIPEGYEIQIRPRSGLSLQGIIIVNSPGTIDSDYRGEISIILYNIGNETFQIKDKQRIAQGVLAKYEKAQFKVVDILNDTTRGEGGFGSTGV